MKARKTALLAVLLAGAIGAQAQVTVQVGSNNDYDSATWMITNLNVSSPSVSGEGVPGISGFVEAIGQMDGSESITLSFTAASDYTNSVANAAIGAGTFGAYVAGLTTAGNKLNGVTTDSWGIDSTANGADTANNNITDNEALIIEVSTANLTDDILLQEMGFKIVTAADFCDVLIYDVSSNTVTVALENQSPEDFSGSYPLANGDIIVIGNRASDNYRWMNLTFDIAGSITNVLTVSGLTAEAGTGQVQLNWTADTTGFLESYNVYRSEQSGTNFGKIATGVATNSYTDTTAVNGTTYYYAVTAVGAGAYETDLSEQVSATPFAALIIDNLTDNQQAETRALADYATGTYTPNGSSVTVKGIRAGEFGNKGDNAAISRSIVKFPLGVADLGDKTIADIEKVWLDLYVFQNLLNAAPTETFVEVYASQTEPANSAVAASDFENSAYTQVGIWTDIATNSPVDMYYAFDVTDVVTNDLSNDVQDAAAGTCLRLQLTDDLLINSTNNAIEGGITAVRFDDNSSANPPQLRIEFNDGRTLYVQWTDQWLPVDLSIATNDYDSDGLNNLYEYALDGNPTNGTQVSATLPALSYTGSGFTYVVPQRSDDDTLVYRVETTDNLALPVWTNLGYVVSGTNVTGETLNMVTNTVNTFDDQKFIRLIIEN